MDKYTLSLLAAIFGMVGSIILAYSLNHVLGEVRFCINALSVSIESAVRNEDVYLFRGLDDRLSKADRISASWVRSGIYCIAASAFFAALSLYVE